MVFRRKKSFRRSFRRGPPLARKRRTWVESVIIDPCNPLTIPFCTGEEPAECCTTRWEQVILDNQVLRDQFSDRAAVRRVLGNLQILVNPALENAANVDEQYARLSASFGTLFCQLLVRPVNAAGLAELPPDIWDSTSLLSGLSESKAKKTWWHHWWATDQFRLNLSTGQSIGDRTMVWKPKLVDCVTGLVTQCLTRAQLTDGSGYTWDYTVPGGVKLDGECHECDGEAYATSVNEGVVGFPRVWNFAFDVRKRIALREDEQLILDFQGRMPFTQFFDDGKFQVLGGGIKTLIEF